MANYTSLRQQQTLASIKSGTWTTLAYLRDTAGKSILASSSLTKEGQQVAQQKLGDAPDGYIHRVLVSPSWDVYVTILPAPGQKLPLLRRSLTLGYGIEELDIEDLSPGTIIAAGATAADRFAQGDLRIVITTEGLELQFRAA